MILKALIFDVDGTLAETEELHRRAFNSAFRDFGRDWAWDEDLYGALLKVTGGKERIAAYQARHRPEETALSGPDIAALHRRKTEHYAALVEGGSLALRPGVGRLIAEAQRDGLRLAIATTTSRPNVVSLLRSAFPLSGHTLFHVIVAGDEVPRKKPAPDVYERALSELGVAPTEAAALEDSRNGVQAASGAGIPVLATPSTYTGTDDFTGAFSVVSDLGERERGHTWLAGLRWPEDRVTCEALRSWVSERSRAA